MAYKNKSDAVKYNNQYNKEAYDRINITVPKGMRDVIKDAALECGESTNAFIVKLVNSELQRLGKI